MLRILCIVALLSHCAAQELHTYDFNYRVEAGGRMCFFQTCKNGQLLEVFYQVLDGQHGDLDISLDVFDPNSVKIISDYKKPQNAFIKELELDGDYSFCLDNTFSSFNSKLVYIYVMTEDQDVKTEPEVVVSTIDNEGREIQQVEALHWTGYYDNGEPYYVEVESLTDSLSRTLKQIVKARHLLDIYAASKSRDSYLAYEETFVVDMWSGIQITFMMVVGMVQVYMIKKLFKSPLTY